MNYCRKIVLLFIIILASCKSKNYLEIAFEKYKITKENQFLSFNFSESYNELRHSQEPWQQTNYVISGDFVLGKNYFLKKDTLTRGSREYYSKTFWNTDKLFFIDFGESKKQKITKSTFNNQVFKNLRYTPTSVFYEFKNNNFDYLEDEKYAIYKKEISNKKVSLYINKSTFLVDKIVVLNHHELFGDATTNYAYNNYQTIDKISSPKEIIISKINGKVIDSVLVKNASLKTKVASFDTEISDFKIEPETSIKKEITTTKYNDNIYLIDLKHTDDKVLAVEFNDFFFVAEAPLTSENGELIIKEVQKINSKKPIKYFAFGHYHPHYLGGIRAFVHKEASIISSEITKKYINYIIKNPRTVKPDSLQTDPKPLKIITLKDSLTITDQHYKMKIFFVGEKSNHTKDYLIYYFPKEKILFQDDAVWISKKSAIKKAGSRQKALYDAIIELNLDVKTIIQSWPVEERGVKTIIPFKELELSTQIK